MKELNNVGIDFNTFKKLITICWCRETAYPSYADRWSKENPSVGQCVPTALLAQDIFGGDIVQTFVNGVNRHFANYINGKMVDFTSEQFNSVFYSDVYVRNRESLLKCKSVRERYYLLKNKFTSVLGGNI